MRKEKIVSVRNSLLFTGILFILCMAFHMTVPVFAEETEEEDSPGHPDYVLEEGITIDGTDVSGLTEQEALEKVREITDAKKARKITLTGPEEQQRTEVKASELGMTWTNTEIIDRAGSYGHGTNILRRYKEIRDLQEQGVSFTTEYSFSRDKIKKVIEKKCDSFNQETIDGSLRKTEDGLEYVKGQTGYKVNVAKSVDQVYTYLADQWDRDSEQEIALDITAYPYKGTEEDLGKCTDLLGRYTTTYYDSSWERCLNIENGCRLISETLLQPDEEFSVLDHLTPFNADNGYYLAGSYLNNKVVESFGGGICQVSTTLYNAVIRAELEIKERSNHSLIVTYVEPSMDAAIAEDADMDMKFVNNTEYPVYIWGTAGDGEITFEVYGCETRDPDRSIAFISETLSVTDCSKKFSADPSASLGTMTVTEAGHQGRSARLIKVVYMGDEEVSSEIFNKSRYSMTPDLISVGTGGVTSGPLIDAIEKDDESAINSEIEKIKAEKKKAEEEAKKKAEEEARKKAEEEAEKQAEEEEKQKVE